MVKGIRRKCPHCKSLFKPDPRNRRHQRYCSAPACRAASKAASQACWLAKPENQHYFRGPVHVSRVQAWRRCHPGYARRAEKGRAPLQDLCLAQDTESESENSKIASSPLQEIIAAQPAVLIGLIAHFVGGPLQEDIAPAARRLLQLGQDILAADDSRREADHAGGR
jgi:hypothetical protein